MVGGSVSTVPIADSVADLSIAEVTVVWTGVELGVVTDSAQSILAVQVTVVVIEGVVTSYC